ncbi:MAG: alpha/beta hydrolase [Ferruginibacter sp.]
MESKYITYQSAKIFYRTIGKGKPVVLIHGFAEDGDIWKNQIEFLKDHLSNEQAGFQLIVPDLPGSGKSDLIKDMSIEGLADAIKEILFLEVSKVSPTGGDLEGAVLIGHSLGGYISLAFAEKYPNLLSSFALVHSSAFADNEEKKANRLKSIEFIKKNGAYEFLKATITGLYMCQDGSEPSDTYIKAQVEKSKAFTDEAIIQYYQAMVNRPDRIAVLKNFGKPILFIIGEHDNAVPFPQSMQQCYLPDRSHIHILRNTAHMGMLEETGKVNHALLHFINTF